MTELGQPNTLQRQPSPPQNATAHAGEISRVSPPSSHQPSEIIHDFLTVPGIAGIALIDGSTIPRLYAADPQLQIHQPKTFLANVTPILRSLAPEVQQLEFFFGTYRLYVCRLGYGFTVAVLTHCTIQWRNNSQDLRNFCQTVQAHLKISIPLLETWASARNNPRQEPVPRPLSAVLPSTVLPSPAVIPPSPSIKLQDYLNAFNHLTTIAARTLGSTIITSQIKRSRPPELQISIDINPKGQLQTPTDSPLTPSDLQQLRQWTQNFRGQCSKIIRDFDTTAQQAGLTSEEAALLKGN
jgi:hypothetical protein